MPADGRRGSGYRRIRMLTRSFGSTGATDGPEGADAEEGARPPPPPRRSGLIPRVRRLAVVLFAIVVAGAGFAKYISCDGTGGCQERGTWLVMRLRYAHRRFVLGSLRDRVWPADIKWWWMDPNSSPNWGGWPGLNHHLQQRYQAPLVELLKARVGGGGGGRVGVVVIAAFKGDCHIYREWVDHYLRQGVGCVWATPKKSIHHHPFDASLNRLRALAALNGPFRRHLTSPPLPQPIPPKPPGHPRQQSKQ